MKDLAKPPYMNMSAASEKRHAMVVQCIDRLRHFAYRAMHVRGWTNRDMVIVCIQVDSRWRALVDVLMPGEDWQKFRDLGQDPVARGTASFSICKVIAEAAPEISDIIMETPTDGYYKCIALDEGGCTVYEIEPIEQ